MLVGNYVHNGKEIFDNWKGSFGNDLQHQQISTLASREEITFHVDHYALLYLVSKQELIGKLARWTLLLQKFEFDILHRLGVQHVVADYLSQLEWGEAGTGVKDDFPDGQLFWVDTVRV